MKNLKKVLALVLAMALSFTMFAGAVAFDDVELGSDYSAAISMLSDLEVVSGNGKGSYEPAKAVTRAEMCVLIANMMNGGKADTARFAGGSNFSDVAHGWWGESAIAYCVQNGITYGVGGGMFAPNREITDAEAVAMLTRAMGYDTAANPLSFPYGNYTAAVNNGIVDNIPYVEGSACTKGEAAQMIYDCLFADYARLTANLNVIHNADDHDLGATLIKDVFGLDRACDDADDCTQHYWVIIDESCEDDVVLVAPIADKSGKMDTNTKNWVEFDCTADVSALMGYKVVLWGEDEHATAKGDVDTVKAVEVVDDQVSYDYNPTMDLEDDLDLKDKEVNTSYNLDVDYITEKNGNSYVLIDWDNDGDIDWINATERYYGEITSLTSKKVVVKIDGTKYTLDLEDGETDKDCYWADEHDYVVELDAEEGDIVEVTVDDAYETTLTITIKTVEPETKEFTELDKKGNMYFDDEAMEQASDRVIDFEPETLKKANVETDYDIWTNANGYIIKWAPASGATEFLMLLGVEDGKDSAIDSKDKNAAIEVMYADGTVEELVVAFDADIDEYSDSTYKFDETEKIVGGVFTYELNDDGEVEELTMIAADATAYEYVDKYDEIIYGGNTVEFTGEDFVFVVDKDYVELDDSVYAVDTSKVAVLTLDELEDIDDEDAVATKGAYDDNALVVYGEDDKDQSKSDDYADGALFVVEDLAAYLGEKNHVVGAITNVSVSKNGVYTFEMNDGTEYTTGKTDKDKTLAEEDMADAADSEVIEELVSGDDEMDDYGYVIYADLTVLDGEVTKVVLLTKAVEGKDYMDRKSDSDFTTGFGSDYRVTRGIVKDVTSDTLRLIRGVVAASDKTIVIDDEYKDASKQVEFELNDDTVIYGVDEIPGLVAGVKLTENYSYDKDADISADGELTESKFDTEEGADILYVVDVIYDDTDEDVPVAAIFAFEDVEDEEPEDKVSYVVEAWNSDGNTKAVAFNVTEVTEDFTGVVKATKIVNMIRELDVEVTVMVKRVVADTTTMGDLGKVVELELAYSNVRMANNGEDVVIELSDALVDDDIVTVSVSGFGVAEKFTFAAAELA